MPAQARKGEQGKSSRAHKTKTSSSSSILAHSTALVHVPAHTNKPASRIGSVSHGRQLVAKDRPRDRGKGGGGRSSALAKVRP